MAGTDAMRALRPLSLATFRATSFMTAAVLTLHLRGSLASVLSRLDTQTGFGFFVVFWVLTWIATRVGLRQAGADASSENLAPDAALMPTTIAGGWNGALVFVVLVVGLLVTLVRAQGISALVTLPVILFGSALGGAIAFATGAIAGFVYGLVDTVVLLVSAALCRWVNRPMEREP